MTNSEKNYLAGSNVLKNRSETTCKNTSNHHPPTFGIYGRRACKSTLNMLSHSAECSWPGNGRPVVMSTFACTSSRIGSSQLLKMIIKYSVVAGATQENVSLRGPGGAPVNVLKWFRS